MAGEGLPVRKRLFHDVPTWVADGALFFITVNCAERGQAQLTDPETSTGLLEAAARYHDEGKWQVSVFLLMPDHWHGLISFPRDTALEKPLRDWKRFTGRRFAIRWQSGFFDHRLRDGNEVEAKARYILHNPVRKGLCAEPGDWPHQLRGSADGCLIGRW
ncbi:MAG: transposase [Verrucomicrobia bacterium]|nr:transposase [Verrucomicrobiota bacterium]